MSHHTPGPWRVFEQQDGKLAIYHDPNNTRHFSDHIDTQSDGTEGVGNMQLIQVAPDMLDALEIVNSYFPFPQECSLSLQEVLRIVRDTIATAKGV